MHRIPFLGLCCCFAVAAAVAGEGSKSLDLDAALEAMPERIKTPDRWALLIGVSDYADERIPDLPACERDVAALRRVLVDPRIGMFPEDQVVALVGEAVDRVEVVDALDRLARQVGPEDLVFVFFSGHGTVDERGRAYWVLPGTDPDRLRATGLPEREVTALLGEIRTSRLVTVIDACYSEATAEVGATKSVLDLARIHPRFDGEGRVAITASRGDQLSLVIEDESHPGYGYSAFAWHLIQALGGRADANADGVVTVDETWGYVKDRTEATSRAEGGEQRPQLKGQIGSKFLLTLNPAALEEAGERYRAAEARRREHLARLEELALDGAVAPEHYRLGRRLLASLPEDLSRGERENRRAFVQVCEGERRPEQLARMLELLAKNPGGRREDDSGTAITDDPEELERKYGTHSREAVELMLASLDRRLARDPTEALSMAEAAIDLDGDFQIGHFHRAEALVALGEIDRAVTAYERTMALEPGSNVAQSARLQLAGMWSRLEDYAAAARWYSRAILADPDDVHGKHDSVYRNWAIARAEEGRPFMAAILARKGDRLDPERNDLAEFADRLAERAGPGDHMLWLSLERPEVPPVEPREMATVLEEVALALTAERRHRALPTWDGRHLVVHTNLETAYRLISPTDHGAESAEIELGDTISALTVHGDRVYAALSDPPRVVRCVAATGEVERRWTLPEAAASLAFLAPAGEIFFCSQGRLFRLPVAGNGEPEDVGILADLVAAHPTEASLFTLRRHRLTAEEEAAWARYHREMDEYYRAVTEANRNRRRDLLAGPFGHGSGMGAPHVPGIQRPQALLDMPHPPRTSRSPAKLSRFLVRSSRTLLVADHFAASNNPDRFVIGLRGRLVGAPGRGGYHPNRHDEEIGSGYGLALFDCWDFSRPRIFHRAAAHPQDAAINPATDQVAMACRGGGLHVFDPLAKEAAVVVEGSFVACAWTGHGRHLVAVQEDGTVRLWRNPLTTGEAERGRIWAREVLEVGRRRIARVGEADGDRSGPGDLVVRAREAIPALAEFASPADTAHLEAWIAGFGDEVRLAGSPGRWQDRDDYAAHPEFDLVARNLEPEADRLGILIYRLGQSIAEESYPPAHLVLARCYLLQNRDEEAVSHLLAAVRGDAGRTGLSVAALRLLAEVTAGEDAVAEAGCLVWAAHLDGNDPDLGRAAAAALRAAGLADAAARFEP